jgi:hypothetical protein
MICAFKGAAFSAFKGTWRFGIFGWDGVWNGNLTFGSANLLQGIWCKVQTKAGV